MRTDWPDGAQVAVSLTFDVDCESALIGRGETHKLSSLSEARFGATRGVPRILQILQRHGISGTFYIPGDTAERHTDACLGVAPLGYRSPSWELTPETLALLKEHKFWWDSSLMGDDRPHLHRDATAPSDFHDIWLAEFESALADHRHVTFTMHPEVIGRGYRAQLLDRLIHAMHERGQVWFATHGDVARWVTT